MLARLSLKSEPLWLQNQRTCSSLFHPLLLLPGDGGEAVQVEAALLLACSPLLRRTIPSNSCCYSSAMTVMLPSSTAAALQHLAQIVAQGSVTIAIEALADFGALLTLLEVDMDRTTSDKKIVKKKENGKCKLSPNSSSKMLSPPPTPPNASRNSTLGSAKSIECPFPIPSVLPPQEVNPDLPSIPSSPGNIKSGQRPPDPPALTSPPNPALAVSLLISIPLEKLSPKTVKKITIAQENPCPFPSSEVKTSNLESEGNVVPLPKLCPMPPPSSRLPSLPPVTCIFCEVTMPIGTSQDIYLQHLEVPPLTF